MSNRLTKFIHDNFDSHKRGSYCKFIDLKNGWGIKLYKSEHMRDSAMNMQKRFSREGLAPAASGTITINLNVYSNYDSGVHYGYFTETITAIKPGDYSHTETIKEFLIKVEEKIGVEYGDWNEFNFGLDDSGRLMAHDFSEYAYS